MHSLQINFIITTPAIKWHWRFLANEKKEHFAQSSITRAATSSTSTSWANHTTTHSNVRYGDIPFFSLTPALFSLVYLNHMLSFCFTTNHLSEIKNSSTSTTLPYISFLLLFFWNCLFSNITSHDVERKYVPAWETKGNGLWNEWEKRREKRNPINLLSILIEFFPWLFYFSSSSYFVSHLTCSCTCRKTKWRPPPSTSTD